MGMNMAGEHCPNCGEELEDGQIGLCESCGGYHLSTDESGERCPACNELRDETANSTHQQWECCACGSWNDKATHGSPELDEDARKLEAMGQDAGPTQADIYPTTKEGYTATMFLLMGMFMGTMTKAGFEGPIPTAVANDLRRINRDLRDLYTRSKIAEACNGD